MHPTLPYLPAWSAAPASPPELPTAARAVGLIAVVHKWSWLALLAGVVFQVLFYASLPNLLAVGCIIISWKLFTKVFLQYPVIRNYPLSTLLMLGYTTTQLYFPLLFTSLENKPVIFNLELPYEVFVHSTLGMVVLTLAHLAYRRLFKPKLSHAPTILRKLGLFDTPTDLQIWLMGIIGLGATIYSYLYSTTGWEVSTNAADKIVQALIPLTYAPLYVLFSRLYGSNRPLSANTVPLLLLYMLALFAVSIGRNSRGGFMVGFSSVGFAYAIGLLLGVYRAQFFTVRNVVLVAGAFWLFTGPIADIGTAMVLVRGTRLNIPYTELIEDTLEAYKDKESIRLYRLANGDQADKAEWEENYLHNIFLARFCNIKFNDLSLVRASKLSTYDTRMFDYSMDYIWAELPQPALDAIGMKRIDKVLLKGSSLGDYLYRIADGPWYIIGWYLTGHFAGIGMATFGWWYLLWLGVGIIPIFLVFDKFFIQGLALTPTSQLPFRFSVCGLLLLDTIFRFLAPFESVVFIAVFLFRNWIQYILFYFLAYHGTRWLVRFIPGASQPTPCPPLLGEAAAR